MNYIYSSRKHRTAGSKEGNEEQKVFMMFDSCGSRCLLKQLEANIPRLLDIFPILDRIPVNTVYDLPIAVLPSHDL